MRNREALAEAADRFWLEQVETDNVLSHPADRVRGYVRAQFGDLAADLGRSAYGILDAHAEHLLQPSEFDLKFDATGKPISLSNKEAVLAVITRRYSSAYILSFKSFFFYLRAYQDVAWVLLREIVEPGVKLTPGIGKGRMSRSFACDATSRDHLLKSVEGYEVWFQEWRTLRDRVKGGVNFGVRIVEDPGVTFTVARVLPDGGLSVGGDGDRIVKMSELTHALDTMTALTRAVRSAKPE